MSRTFFNSLLPFFLLLAFNLDVVRAAPQPTTAHSSSSLPSQCHVYPTTAPVIYTAQDGSRATYSGPPQLTSTSFYYGAIVHLEVFTLVAVQIPQYATTPGAWTVISTTNTWGQQTTQAVGSNGWVWKWQSCPPTSPVPDPTPPPARPGLQQQIFPVVGGQQISEDASGYAVGTQQIVVGGHALTVSSEQIFAVPGGLVIGSSTWLDEIPIRSDGQLQASPSTQTSTNSNLVVCKRGQEGCPQSLTTGKNGISGGSLVSITQTSSNPSIALTSSAFSGLSSVVHSSLVVCMRGEEGCPQSLTTEKNGVSGGSTASITRTNSHASPTLTSSVFSGLSSVVPGEAVINGTQTISLFTLLSLTRDLQTGTQTALAPTSTPTGVGAGGWLSDCHGVGGLYCIWWWGTVGWGLCLSCTPNGNNIDGGKGTIINIITPPTDPGGPPPHCPLFFLCPSPKPGTNVQSVQGVEDEPPDDQPTVEVNGEDPDDRETTTTTSATSVTSRAPTSTSTSSDTWEYVWPADMNNTVAIQSEIDSLELDPDRVYIASGTLGTLFWALFGLNSTQIDTLQKIASVAAVTSDPPIDADELYDGEAIADDGGVVRRAGAEPSNTTSPTELQLRATSIQTSIITSQSPTPTELQFVSAPRFTDLAKNSPYYFDSISGSNTYVFVVDLGWQWPPGYTDATVIDDEQLEIGLYKNPGNREGSGWSDHGVCAASKAVGKQFGVVKNAVIIPVKLAYQSGGVDFVAALFEIYNYITDPTRKWYGRAVITQSFTPSRRDINTVQLARYEEVIDALLAIGVPIAVAGGNQGNSYSRIDKTPLATFAQTKKGVFVVSGVDQTGQLWEKSQWIQGAPVIFAVSKGISCIGTSGATTATGTSFAAPQLAGLISYFQAINFYSDNPVPFNQMTAWLVDKINDLAYPRQLVPKNTPGAPATGWPILNMINNGVNTNNDCKPQKRQLADRDASPPDACALETTSSSSHPSPSPSSSSSPPPPSSSSSSTTASTLSPSASGLGGGLTPPGTTLGTKEDPCFVEDTLTCSCKCIANDGCGNGCGEYVAYCNTTINCCMCDI